LAQHGDEAVVRAALESALIRRSPVAVRRAAQLVEEGRPDHADAAVLFALAAGPDSIDLLLRASAKGSIRALEALGWYGHSEAIEHLLERLEGESATAALEALQFVTGASLTDAHPCPGYEEGEGPFTAAEGPVPLAEILCAAPDKWRAWWKEYGKAARPGARYRFGHLWSLGDDLRQMEAPPATARQRRFAYLELCARSGSSLPFDAQAFVAAQRRQISGWSAGVSHKQSSQGWPVRLERQ
jgi:HEAT repeat protein